MENRPTNKQESPIKADVATTTLNDIGFRLILIPFFGIVIPLVTGMINGKNFSNWEIKLSFLYTILIAFVVWQGNRYLLFTLRSYFHWFNQPLKKIGALLLAISFYTIPISTLMLAGWYHLFAKGKIDWQIVFTATLIIMICVIFITHVYETVFLVRDSETEIVKNAQLERARAEAELEALKNQIDPHFIFNSLNTLSHLIEEKPARAREFNDNLADVYRYILHNKGRDLVQLKEEMDFAKEYFFLLKIRFEKAVDLKLEVDPEVLDTYLIPPISLQLLLENAIKHNQFTDEHPLLIKIQLLDGQLKVSNNFSRKTDAKPSSKIGLSNLQERYKLTTNSLITFMQTENEFTVLLPLLKID